MDRQQCHHQCGTASYRHRDNATDRHHTTKCRGEVLHSPIQFGVGQRLPTLVDDHRDGARCEFDLASEHTRQGQRTVYRHCTTRFGNDQCRPVRRSRRIKLGQPQFRVGRALPQHLNQTSGKRVHRALIEEISGIFDATTDPAVGGFSEVERQVELGRSGFEEHRARVKPGHLDPVYGVAVLHQYLEQWLAGQGTGRGHRLDQLLERNILMRIGIEVRSANPLQELRERRIARQVGA